MHGRRPDWNILSQKVGRELIVGILLGVVCGLIVGGVALAWKRSLMAGLSLFVGISGGVMAAAGIGAALPYLLRLLRRDPRLASGPLALALSDLVILLLYFNIARTLLL